MSAAKKAMFTVIGSQYFDRETGSMCKGAVFLEETSAAPRCSSRVVPRDWEPHLPKYLKCTKTLASDENLQLLATAANCEELKSLIAKCQSADAPESYWETMDWAKEKERGIIFILQGLKHRDVHHIWSCADKPSVPALPDGRFFKEANLDHPYLKWSLDQLCNDSARVHDLVYTLLLLEAM